MSVPARVLIRFAEQDERYLKALEKHLSALKLAHLVETWSRQKLAPGDDVEHRMRQAIQGADLVLVLVSADFMSAELRRDGAPLGVFERGLADRSRVVPVRVRPVVLHGTPLAGLAALPSGDRAVSEWANKDAAWADVAEGVRRLLSESGSYASGPSRSAPGVATERGLGAWEPVKSRSVTPEEPTHTSIVLDRILQWDKLVERCGKHDREHLVFVVHGSMNQDLHLFLRRIQSYLNEQCGWLHSIVKVERSRDGTTARSADEWKRSLLRACRVREGELDFVLSVEAQTAPVLLVLTDEDGPLRGLDKTSTKGLVQFLRGQIDSALTLLEKRNALRHPVRIVIPIEHPQSKAGAADPMVEQVEKAILGATTLRLERLPPLELPSWTEIEAYIKKTHPEADAAILTACAEIHRAEIASPQVTLQQLGDAVDNALIDWLQDRHYGTGTDL